jgi:hypothetical protein
VVSTKYSTCCVFSFIIGSVMVHVMKLLFGGVRFVVACRMNYHYYYYHYFKLTCLVVGF